MPRGQPCTVCIHPDLVTIDARLAAPGSVRAVAREYGVTQTSIRRHKSAHLSDALVTLAAAVTQEARQAVPSVLDRLHALTDRAEEFLATAQKAGNAHQGLSAIREARGTLELIARITRELDERAVTVLNVMASPDWIRVRTAYLSVLSRNPEALVTRDQIRFEIADALGELDE